MKKGFTLLELLIVIAILAILASTAVVVLNPAEILRKSRDSSRLQDLDSMRTALNYYIANTSTPVLGSQPTIGCMDQTVAPCTAGCTYSHLTGVFSGSTVSSASTTRTVGGAGWIPVALSSLTGGSPLSSWPVDPTNSSTSARYYAYQCNYANTTFTLYANMESATYKNGGSSDVESKDGGSIAAVYEVGTAFLTAATGTNFFNDAN
ncbi:MAG: hypothetical protein UX65_C0003G0046 [Parcubacteria group bacterium GW2011_GWB1_46_8]|nr:MAG: hypothetical protein UX65_C0003G0046 [Parcubacteria group bacterium GW2011_GWB1_46_8]